MAMANAVLALSAAPGCRRLPSRGVLKIVKGKSRVEALLKPVRHDPPPPLEKFQTKAVFFWGCLP